MDARHDTGERSASVPAEPHERVSLPSVTNDERAFWRRAVDIERRRKGIVRPAPFPFQPA